MSRYPGVCVPAPGAPARRRLPGGHALRGAPAVVRSASDVTHYFTSVEVPLSPRTTPTPSPTTRRSTRAACRSGSSRGATSLLRHTFRFALDRAASPRRPAVESPSPRERRRRSPRARRLQPGARDSGSSSTCATRAAPRLRGRQLDRPDEDLRDKRFVRVRRRRRATRLPGRPAGRLRRRRRRRSRRPGVWSPSPPSGRHVLPRQGPRQLPERLPPLRAVHRRHRRRRALPGRAGAGEDARRSLRRRRSTISTPASAART